MVWQADGGVLHSERADWSSLGVLFWGARGIVAQP
jgi:hypothetical protein